MDLNNYDSQKKYPKNTFKLPNLSKSSYKKNRKDEPNFAILNAVREIN